MQGVWTQGLYKIRNGSVSENNLIMEVQAMNTEFEQHNIFGIGQENTTYAPYFMGKSYPQSAGRTRQKPHIPGERYL